MANSGLAATLLGVRCWPSSCTSSSTAVNSSSASRSIDLDKGSSGKHSVLTHTITSPHSSFNESFANKRTRRRKVAAGAENCQHVVRSDSLSPNALLHIEGKHSWISIASSRHQLLPQQPFQSPESSWNRVVSGVAGARGLRGRLLDFRSWLHWPAQEQTRSTSSGMPRSLKNTILSPAWLSEKWQSWMFPARSWGGRALLARNWTGSKKTKA